MQEPKVYCKLDMYDYQLVLADNEVTQVFLDMDSIHDIDIADIASEITASDGNIYVEGHYLEFIQMEVGKKSDNTACMILHVNEV